MDTTPTTSMKPVCLNLSECNGLGDLICATPVIKKLRDVYDEPITVVSQMPELFKGLADSYKASSIDWDYFNEHYTMYNSFYNVGKKNERGVEMKHNVMDIRQFHAINLGFMLDERELECEYIPTEVNRFNDLPEKYVVIHPVTTWANRTWAAEKWMDLVKKLNDDGVYVVSIGKDSSETGFFNVEKPVFNFDIPYGMNLMNQTSISDCYHLINNATCFITMDSGLLHLAGTTIKRTPIIHLGSALNHKFRAPYRFGTQSYNYHYIDGDCHLQCCSDMKYGVKEWGDIQGVQPLIGCLENYDTFECHPDAFSVYILTMAVYAKATNNISTL